MRRIYIVSTLSLSHHVPPLLPYDSTPPPSHCFRSAVQRADYFLQQFLYSSYLTTELVLAGPDNSLIALFNELTVTTQPGRVCFT